MSVDLKLLDLFKLFKHSSRNFACSLSEDNRLFIITNTGVYVICFAGEVAYPLDSFCCKKFLIKVSSYAPCDNVDINLGTFIKECDRKDLYETVMSTEYTANLKHAKPVDPLALTAAWSPRGFFGQTDCLLAILTNLHSLEIYGRHMNKSGIFEFNLLINISEKVIEVEKPHWADSTRLNIERKLAEFKRRVDSVATTAFTWTHAFEENGALYCCIIAGHINGDISIYRLSRNLSTKALSFEAKFLGRYTTQLKRITTLHWHATSNYGGGLSFADVDGRMSVLHVIDLHKDEVLIDKELAFWTEQDHVLVEKITVISYQDHTYLLLVKQHVLIIYGIDKYGEIFDNKAIKIEGFYITGLHHSDNIITVLSMTGILTQLKLSVQDNKISIEEENIPIKIPINQYQSQGLSISKNKALYFIICCPAALNYYNNRSYVHVYIFHNAVVKPFDLLWNNKSKSLYHYWDCIETLRLLCLKENRFPWLGLPSDLNYDKLNLLELKTLRMIAKMSEMVYQTVDTIKNYNIKPYIVIHYMVEIQLVIRRIKILLHVRNSGKELTMFQMCSIDIQNFFLKEMVAQNILAKANVGKRFVTDMIKVIEIANELKYPDMMQCRWCGEKIIGPCCIPPHADSRCSISMMPLFLAPSYKCAYCKCLAHKEIEKEETIICCPYCDLPMDIVTIDSEQYEKEAHLKTNDFGEVTSVCFEDCLKDQDFSDIEDNTCEFVIVSDSEDDNIEDDKLKTLYCRFEKITLDELINLDDKENYDEAGPSKILRLSES